MVWVEGEGRWCGWRERVGEGRGWVEGEGGGDEEGGQERTLLSTHPQDTPHWTGSYPLLILSSTTLLPLCAGRWICLQMFDLSLINCSNCAQTAAWLS